MADSALLLRDIRALCPGIEILENEPLSRHCSFRIGGPCRALIAPSSAEEIETLSRLFRRAGIRPLLMGRGSDLLITDRPLDRLVLCMGDNFSRITRPGSDHLRAQSGVTLARLAAAAAGEGLSGLEFSHGIPGTLGGAVSMNAGAYGGEMKDVICSVRYLDEDLRIQETPDGEFSYRHSRFSDTDCIILEAEAALRPGDTESIRARMRELMEKRRTSQPLDQPSAGSTFKRPPDGYAAAMIDEAGLKGYAIGGAMVSPRHAGFVVNTGNAGFDDVLRLIEHIQNEVYLRTGTRLEPEVKIIRE